MNLIARFIEGFVTRLLSENVELKVTTAECIRWFFHSILSKCKEIIKFLICFVILESNNIWSEISKLAILFFISMEKLLDRIILLFEESRIISYYLNFNTLYSVSVPLCHPENSNISNLLKTVNHKGIFPILEIDGSLRIGVEKSYFNSTDRTFTCKSYSLWNSI